MALQAPLHTWVFADGKAGHENQSVGLVNAISDIRPVQHHRLPPVATSTAMACLLTRRVPKPWQTLPTPDLIIGAGSRTHLSMLAAKRAFRAGRTVVLMRPSYPSHLFDLCLIPQHDMPGERENIIPTQGVLNVIRRSPQHVRGAGLFLIGGPSKHHAWDDAQIIQQVIHIVEADPDMRWTLTTSRRTPESFLKSLSGHLHRLPATRSGVSQADNAKRFHIVPASETPHGWVPEQLQRCATVWVSEDSVSMVYEALTAGASVGILTVPRRRSGRVTQAIDTLEQRGMVKQFSSWTHAKSLPTTSGLTEAQRCAKLIVDRWFTPEN